MRVDIGKEALCAPSLPYRLLQMLHISAPCGHECYCNGGMVLNQHAPTVTVPNLKGIYFKKVLIPSSVVNIH